VNCEELRNGDLIERYVAGDLDAAARDRVEAHYFECDDCFEQVQLARALREEFPGPPRVRERPVLAYAALAAGLILVAACGAWIVMLRRENLELEQRLARAASPPPAAIERQAQEIAALRTRLDALSQPELNAPIVDLEPDDRVRRGGAPSPVVELAGGVRQITFVLTAGEVLGPGPYSVSIVDGAGRVVWESSGLRRSRFDTFTLAVPAALLPTGAIAIRLRSTADTRPGRVQEYDFRVVRR
jgi:anti-sigma factor RsiW